MSNHIFEGRITGPVCYCVPNAIGACATCRAERQERAAFDVVKESDRIAEAAALAPVAITSTPKPLVSDWIEKFMKARDKAIAESFVTTKRQVVGVDPAKPGADGTYFFPNRKFFAGGGPDLVVFDEAADIPQEAFESIKLLNAPGAHWFIMPERTIDPPVITSRPEHRSYDEYRQVYGGVTAKEMMLKPGREHLRARSISPELDGTCQFLDCDGTYREKHHGDGGCSCHLAPPCGWCTETTLICSECGDEPE